MLAAVARVAAERLPASQQRPRAPGQPRDPRPRPGHRGSARVHPRASPPRPASPCPAHPLRSSAQGKSPRHATPTPRGSPRPQPRLAQAPPTARRQRETPPPTEIPPPERGSRLTGSQEMGYVSGCTEPAGCQLQVLGALSLSQASCSGLKGQEKAANRRKLCSASPRSCRSGTETGLLFGVLFGGDFVFVLLAHRETFIWLPLASQKRRELRNKCFVFFFVFQRN